MRRSLAPRGVGAVVLAVALAAPAACHRDKLPRPPLGAQGPRPPSSPCDGVAEFPPPPARVEELTAPDRNPSGCVWVDGYWRWDGRRYSWSGGGYVRAPAGCHLGAAASFWLPGGSERPRLCLLYPGFFADRGGARCTEGPCPAPDGASAHAPRR